ncbi:MAG: alpha/beta fold hydrolase [Rhodoluna sp.]
MDRAQARAVKRSLLVNGILTDYWFYAAPKKDAQNIVLVHGYRGDHHGLESFAGGLDQFNIYSPDIPGFGISKPFQGEHNLEAYVDWLVKFVEKLDLKNPIGIGHSFGTLVVCGAQAKSQIFQALVCINPVAGGVTKGLSNILMRFVKGYYWLAHMMPEPVGMRMIRTRFLVDSMSSYTTKSKDKALRNWIKYQHRSHFNSFANSQVVWESYVASISNTLQPYVSELNVPIFLVAAELDEVTPVSAVLKLAERLPQAKVHQIYNCGHLVHYEAAAATCKEITRFISEIKS